MLRFLSITNLAVIDSAQVEFEPGLNVLTGETGAGKSILVEAVGLLLGGRASSDLVRTGEDKADIQAIFEHEGEELIVRREITAQGRSRAFINDTLATAGALKELASRLIELHGQHEHQTLLDPSTHLEIVDAFGGLTERAASVAARFGAMCAREATLSQLRQTAAERDARRDLAGFQFAELERAALDANQPEEDTILLAARQVLVSAGRVERLCTDSYAALYDSDGAILSGLGTVWRHVTELAELDARFQPYVDAREGIKSQLEDLAVFLRRYADTIDASPGRLQQVEERLATLERIKRKYGPTLRDAIVRRESLRRDVEDLDSSDARIAQAEREAADARRTYRAAAESLSAARRRAATDLGKRVEGVLAELAMERTRFEVRFGEPLSSESWSAQGIDQAEFFVSPNPGEELRALTRIVSGGELSRIMLAIKTMTAAGRHGFSDADGRPPSGSAPGLVFDEVDAGIGGRVAEVVGRKLLALGSVSQVLCITHLPQIASRGDTHFVVEKRVEQGRTRTSVRRLDADARVEEVARMLGGERITDGLRASAREMLKYDAKDARPVPPGRAKGRGESERAKAKPSRA